jgi:cytochrome b561
MLIPQSYARPDWLQLRGSFKACGSRPSITPDSRDLARLKFANRKGRDRSMPIRNSTDRYGNVAQLLHWLIVVLIILQVILALIADDMPLGVQKLTVLARHKSFGMTILGLAVLRVLWRFMNPVPTLPTTLKPYERGLARVTHVLLYVLMFAMPLSGWVMSTAHNYPVSWFGLFTWPNPVAPDKELAELMEEVHESLAYTLGAVVTLHVLAALKHHFVLKDNVLKRMLPFTKT